MRILLVEDHQESRKDLQRLIERRGHEVVAVGSAEEAKQAIAAQAFPFLILDWMLPGKSGIELCRELRAQPRGDDTFILLVTARDDTGDLEQALAAGANDYLTKPLDLALLNVRLSVAERQIRELAERNQARVALQESARAMTEILEKTTDAFFAVDREWKFIYLNPEAETLLGRRRDEWGSALLPVGDQFVERAGLKHGARENMGTDFGALFDDADREFASGRHRQLP